MHLASQRYGKNRVRVLRVRREASGVHVIHEVEASVALEGDFSAAYLTDDNSQIIATDTMKNTVQVLARKYLGDVLEEFALACARHFLKRYGQISRVIFRINSRPWDRYQTPENVMHPHTFTGRSNALPFSRVEATRDQVLIQSGVEDMLILKSADSAFVGYPQCEYTTLPETRDRILATSMQATWTFTRESSSYTKANASILSALLDTFAKEFSPSVQNTLFLMGSAALAATSEISDIHLIMPNKHYLPVNFKPFNLENNNEIFLPTDEPHGQIEAHISR